MKKEAPDLVIHDSDSKSLELDAFNSPKFNRRVNSTHQLQEPSKTRLPILGGGQYNFLRDLDPTKRSKSRVTHMAVITPRKDIFSKALPPNEIEIMTEKPTKVQKPIKRVLVKNDSHA